MVIGLGDGQIKVTRQGNLESALSELQADGMDYAIVEGFKSSNLPKIVLGGIEAPNVVKRIEISHFDDASLKKLKDLVMGMDDFRGEDLP